MKYTRQAFLLALSLVLLTATPSVFAQREDNRRDGPALKNAFKEVIAKPTDSTVRIVCDGKNVALGTVVGADGWIVTKFSELKGPVQVVLKDGRSFEAKVVGVHEPNDLAMLKIEAKNLKSVEWIDSKTADVGDWVASPGLTEVPLAIGVVGVKSRKVNRGDLPNSDSGFLGIRLEPADKGVRITEVTKNQGADKAGVKINDVIIAVNGKPTPTPEALVEQVQRHKVDDVIKLKLRRDDKELELKATLGKRPVDKADMQNRMGNELSSRRGGFPAVLQHDSFLKPTDCGGPLVDLDGKTVGVNIARAGRVETYAVPAEAVQALLVDLESGKMAPAREASDAERKVAEARSVFDKAMSDKKTAESKANEAKSALEKATAEKENAEKKAAEAKSALEKAEAEANKEKENKENK